MISSPKNSSYHTEAPSSFPKSNEYEDFFSKSNLSQASSPIIPRKNRMPEIAKSQGNSTNDLKALESMKLFETEDPKKAKKSRILQKGSPKTSASKSRFSTEGDCSLAPSPLQDLTKEKRRLKPLKLEDREQLPSLEKVASPASSVNSVRSLDFFRSKQNSRLPSLGHDNKSPKGTFMSFVSPLSGNNFTTQDFITENSQEEPPSPKLPLRKFRTSNFEKGYKPSQFRERSLNQSVLTFHEEENLQKMIVTEMGDERDGIVNKGLGESSFVNEKKFTGSLLKDWTSTFKKSKSHHNVRLQKAKEWRTKVFQKTPFPQK